MNDIKHRLNLLQMIYYRSREDHVVGVLCQADKHQITIPPQTLLVMTWESPDYP